MTTMAEIEERARIYANERVELIEEMKTLDAEISALKEQRLGSIRYLAEQAANSKAALDAAIDSAPTLFARPRTKVFHGIRVGFAKAKGKIKFEDAETVVRLIRKHFPKKVDELVKTVDQPVKATLSLMSAAELKRLGVTVEETGDEVVIKPTDSEIDKLVDALLTSADDERAAK